MYRIVSLFLLLVGAGPLLAQQGGYLYIESDPPRPFYLRTTDSIILSSQGSYLLLAPLKPWVGDIIVGIQGQQQAAFVFSLNDSLQERGLLLKDMGREGWRLVDWRKNESVNIRRLGRDEQSFSRMRKRSDAFALRLSQVMNDSTILYYEPPKIIAAQTNAIKADSAFERPVVQRGDIKIADTIAAKPELFRVKKLHITDLGTSWKLIYEVTEPEGKDTVEIEIIKLPLDKKPKKKR